MKLAIMQPYFLPYLGYFQLVNSVDEFVVYDNIEFSKKGWFHRNRILVNGKDLLFTLPLKKDSDFLSVHKRQLSDDSEQETNRLLRVITNSYSKAPYFKEVYPLLERCFKFEDKNLFNFIYHSLKIISGYIGIKDKFIISSEIPIDHSNLKGQDKVIAICKSRGANHYINAIGGKELYDGGAFKSNGIDLSFIKMDEIKYRQFGSEFVPSLSIVDIMMFNNREQITKMLKMYTMEQ